MYKAFDKTLVWKAEVFRSINPALFLFLNNKLVYLNIQNYCGLMFLWLTKNLRLHFHKHFSTELIKTTTLSIHNITIVPQSTNIGTRYQEYKCIGTRYQEYKPIQQYLRHLFILYCFLSEFSFHTHIIWAVSKWKILFLYQIFVELNDIFTPFFIS